MKVIKNNMTHEERMMHRIRALYRDLESCDGDMKYLEDTLMAIDQYLIQFDDPYLEQACWRLKECIFYVAQFNQD